MGHDDGYTISTRPYRSLVRVLSVGKTTVDVVLPSWVPDEPILLEIIDLPSEIQKVLASGGVYFHAWVNIGARTKSQLRFTNWEVW